MIEHKSNLKFKSKFFLMFKCALNCGQHVELTLRKGGYKHKKVKKKFLYLPYIFKPESFWLTFVMRFVRNCKFFSSFCATGLQDFAAIGSRHSFAEAMFVYSFFV